MRVQIVSALVSKYILPTVSPVLSCRTFNWRNPDSKDGQPTKDAELIATGAL